MDGNATEMTAGYYGHCGCYHSGQCPKIKAIEYYPNGMIKRLEYYGELQPTHLPITPPANSYPWATTTTYIPIT